MRCNSTTSEATLELSILSVDVAVVKTSAAGTKTTTSWLKPPRYHATAWIDVDPSAAQSTGPIGAAGSNVDVNVKRKRKLYFPIHSNTLEASNVVTIQIVSHRRVPFQGGRRVGTAVLRMSDVKMSAETFALPIRREEGPGEVRGSLIVSARVLWDLGFRGKEDNTGGSSEIVEACFPMVGAFVEPSAPPESVATAPPGSVAETDGPLREEDGREIGGGGKEGNFLVGLIVGALVVIFAGGAYRCWKSKSLLKWSSKK